MWDTGGPYYRKLHTNHSVLNQYVRLNWPPSHQYLYASIPIRPHNLQGASPCGVPTPEQIPLLHPCLSAHWQLNTAGHHEWGKWNCNRRTLVWRRLIWTLLSPPRVCGTHSTPMSLHVRSRHVRGPKLGLVAGCFFLQVYGLCPLLRCLRDCRTQSLQISSVHRVSVLAEAQTTGVQQHYTCITRFVFELVSESALKYFWAGCCNCLFPREDAAARRPGISMESSLIWSLLTHL